MLTVAEIKAIKPQEKTKRYTDAKRMYLEVTPKGGMYWRMKYDFGGKEKLLALGTYPDVSLAEARVKRDDAKKLISQGIDPNAAKKEAKIIESGALTFESIANQWMDDREDALTDVYDLVLEAMIKPAKTKAAKYASEILSLNHINVLSDVEKAMEAIREIKKQRSTPK